MVSAIKRVVNGYTRPLICCFLMVICLSVPAAGRADTQFLLTVATDSGTALEGITVYAFTEGGSYTGQSAGTGEDGTAAFDTSLLTEESYNFRADYLGYQFWTGTIAVEGDTAHTLTIPHQDVTVTVTATYQSESEALEGLTAYLFTEAGSYQSVSTTTDSNGQATFSLPEQSYQIRADYLSGQYWSDAITWTDATIDIARGAALVAVTGAGTALADVTVYVFSSGDTYLGISGTTAGDGMVEFILPEGDYRFRADSQGSEYWSDTTTVTRDQETAVPISTGGGTVTLTVEKSVGNPVTGINVYAFSSEGTYLGLSAVADDSGLVSFDLSDGEYQFRADYLGYQFWTGTISVDGDVAQTLAIPHQDVTVTVTATYQSESEPLEGLTAYLFTEAGSYQSVSTTTDSSGQVTFSLPEQSYKIRADYLSGQYWSDAITWTDAAIDIAKGAALITVTGAGEALADVTVYVFTSSDAYLGISGTTADDGTVEFILPEGDYRFRADSQGSQYWSDTATVTRDQETAVPISTGGGTVTLTVATGDGSAISGINAYLFSDTGTYLSSQDTTGEDGTVSFSMGDGSYKIRMDYLGYQFWTDAFTLPGETGLTFTIAHTDVIATVQTLYIDETTPLEGVTTYVFTEAGSYQSLSTTTDADGKAVFTLPDQAYKIRADYLSGQYWSDAFTAADTDITVELGEARVQVLQGSSPVADVTVYVFTEEESYTGVSGTTGDDGTVTFRLPEDTWKFRADFQGSQYWASAAITAHQATDVEVDSGGGSFTLTVEKATDDPITGINVYAFSSDGTYLGLSGVSDDSGTVTFDLSDGDYKFRADYLGYQYWTETVTVPDAGSDTLSIPHQDVTVTVSGQYEDTFPIQGVTTYLFTESGSYQSLSSSTDDNGQAVYSLPAQSYMIRADYLSTQYWSDAFVQADTEIIIDHAKAVITVTLSGTPVSGAQVYLFSESESYLGVSATTDDDGIAEFTIPAGTCKFRIDFDGSQYWTETQDLVALEKNAIAFDPDPVDGDYGNDDYTVLLISSDNADGDAVFTDTSQGGDTHSITPSGDVHHDTGQSKFNGSAIGFDGDGDMLSIDAHSDFEFGTDDFTIDCWVKSNSSEQGVIFEIGNYTTGVMMQIWEGNIYLYVAGSFAGYAFSPSADTWYHLAMVRQSGTLHFYINGVAQTNMNGTTEALSGSAVCDTDLRIGYGHFTTEGIGYFDGYIDEFRISKGIARWTTDFDPATESYSTGVATAFGQSVTLADSTSLDIKLTGTGSVGNGLTYTIETYPFYGELTGSPPNVTYTPEPAYTGSDSFTFSVDNGMAASEPATVSIEIYSAGDCSADSVAPVITLIGDETVNLTYGEAYTEAGATARDACDGDLTDYILISNPVDANSHGQYIVTYDVWDDAGNGAQTVQRIVNVEGSVNSNHFTTYEYDEAGRMVRIIREVE